MSSFEDRKATGTVFNVQRYSVHDGPGIRTIIFLNGCSLACRWCSNPESQNGRANLAYNPGRCITVADCGHCIEACPRHSVTAAEDGKIAIDRSHCLVCADRPCIAACPAKSLIAYGERKTVDQVLRMVEQDASFYARSGGGMTLSGGEPLFHRDFAVPLLREARLRRIKTAIETCGNVPWEHFEEAAPHLNYVLFDIKHMDDAKHREWTGDGNARILANFRKLAEARPDLPILCRTPVIPGFNDNEADIRAIAEYIAPFPNVNYELLAYHRLGTQKYGYLARPYEMGDVSLAPDVTPRLQALADQTLKTMRR